MVKAFLTSDSSDAAHRPKLVITGTNDTSGVPNVTLGATTTPVYAYAYDAVGNMLSATGQGAYSYAGTGYANPHAATSVGSTSLSYDQNGNLTAEGGASYAWDYANRLASSTGAAYAYDHLGQRVSKAVNGAATYYPNSLYTAGAATTTKDIYMGDALIASVKGTGTSTAALSYLYQDHLGSARFVTDDFGNLTQSLDYAPYGSQTASNEVLPDRGFIGQEYDEESNLSYLNARYYDGARGQFTSQDPVHLAVGDSNQLKQLTGQDMQTYLMNPQQLNSYSYAGDNPIVNKDPTGRAFGVDDAAGFFGGGLVGALTYTASSLATQQPITLGGLGGSFVTGGIIGWGAINTPETLGASNAVSASIITGLIGGFYGDVTKQGIDLATGKQTGGVNLTEAQVNAVTTAYFSGLIQGGVGNAKIPGLSSGRGNMNAIGDALRTKTANGMISNISSKAALKSAVGSQAADAYRNFINSIFDTSKSNSNTKNKK